MYRAVVLTTLVLLLLAVAGVSAAQGSGIFTGGPNSDDPPGSTTQERTSFEATVAEDTMASVLPGASSEPKVGESASEPTVVTEPTVGETENPTVAAPSEQTLLPGSNNFGKPAKSARGVGKSALVGKVPNIGNPPDEVVHPANGKPQERGNEGEHGRGGSQQKITLCHKNKNTLTVGAPALAAHQRHGDTQGGACQTEGAGSEPSGETMKPEAAKHGGADGSGGQDKVTLCHKNKILTVGAQAQEAHMRHGDTLEACPPAG
jgi:hypothetical protein